MIMSGIYPHYLWLFKEFLPLIKDGLLFQGIKENKYICLKFFLFCVSDNLLTYVAVWKNMIVERGSFKLIFYFYLIPKFCQKWGIQLYLPRSLTSQKLQEKKKIIFIGIHCRRTDYKTHYEKVSGSSLVDHVYFDKALEIFR